MTVTGGEKKTIFHENPRLMCWPFRRSLSWRFISSGGGCLVGVENGDAAGAGGRRTVLVKTVPGGACRMAFNPPGGANCAGLGDPKLPRAALATGS